MLVSWLVAGVALAVGWGRLRGMRRAVESDGLPRVEAWLASQGGPGEVRPGIHAGPIPAEEEQVAELLELLARAASRLDQSLLVVRHAAWLSRELQVGRSIPYAAARVSLAVGTLTSLLLIAVSSGEPLITLRQVALALVPGLVAVAFLRRWTRVEVRLAKERCDRWLTLGARLSNPCLLHPVDPLEQDR